MTLARAQAFLPFELLRCEGKGFFSLLPHHLERAACPRSPPRLKDRQEMKSRSIPKVACH
jgi:hypothetical protein